MNHLIIFAIIWVLIVVLMYVPCCIQRMSDLMQNGMLYSDAKDAAHNELMGYGVLSIIIATMITAFLYKTLIH